MKFSKLAQSLMGSATMAATLRAQALKAQGQDILLATVGEPDADVATEIKEELVSQLQKGVSRYGPSQGLLSTREAIVKWFLDIYGSSYTAQQILITPGSKFGLYALMQILCEEGDEVLIPAPYWVSYVTLAEMSRARACICEPNDQYKITPQSLSQVLTAKSRVLILNSPNNPTGAVYTRQELESLYQVLKDHPQVTVICDDIYNQLIFSDSVRAPSLLDVVDDDFKKRVVIVHGVSKSYAMTGWRLGWIAAEAECIDKLSRFVSQTLTCTPDFIQKAVEQALEGGARDVENLKNQIRARHAQVFQALAAVKGLKVYPSQGAFYLWIKLEDRSQTSSQICERLLNEKLLACVPGEAFGMPYHLRLSVTMPEDQLEKAIVRLKDFFSGN